MRTGRELPGSLGEAFSVQEARNAGVAAGRLRRRDLSHPFHAVRSRGNEPPDPRADAYETRRFKAMQKATAYARRMRTCEFFSHETAALIWNAPLPLPKGDAATDAAPHVSTFRENSMPRARGVHGHRVDPRLAVVTTLDGLRVTTPASTWAMLGHLPLYDLVAVGDYFVRVWREDGYYRANAGVPPLTTIAELDAAVRAGRRVGIRALRLALPLIRTNAWSRTESWTRLVIVQAGLPEPELNRDFYDEHGVHLACIDLAYPEYKVAIEYQGQFHGAQYARDIERIERLRAAGWAVIQVSSELLFGNPEQLVQRVRTALSERGWRA